MLSRSNLKTSKLHNCDLKLDTNSMSSEESLSGFAGKFHRKWSHWSVATHRHPLAPVFFKSYSAVLHERKRHRLFYGPLVIHPLSKLNYIWNTFMAIVFAAHICAASTRYSFIIKPASCAQYRRLDIAILILDIICLVDIVVRFNTGIADTHLREISLDRKAIVLQYLKHYFVFDFLSSMPFELMFCWVGFGYVRLICHLLPLLKSARVLWLVNWLLGYIKHSLYTVRVMLRNVLLYIIFVHWAICLLYFVTMTNYYLTGVETTEYNQNIVLIQNSRTRPRLSTVPMAKRYTRAYFVVIATFFGRGYSMFRALAWGEIICAMVINLSCTMFFSYTIALLLERFMTKFNAQTRYYEMMDQVQNYMKQKQLPVSLQQRILQFYDYKYQKSYFKDTSEISTISEHLQQEIDLQLCRKLVSSVLVFEGLPKSLIGTILGCLRPETYLANDLIIRAGDTGDSMYFICSGTVAVYTRKGIEVCHLEDGAFFGEVALLMKDNKRIATVVATEITELYRLDGVDYRKYVATYEPLYERIQKIAFERMNQSTLVDEDIASKREGLGNT